MTAIDDGGAPPGDYRFVYVGPFDPTETAMATVLVCLGEGEVQMLTYPWHTTVSGQASGLSFTFEFPALFSITVMKAGTGTMNLFGMPESIFDGQHALPVP